MCGPHFCSMKITEDVRKYAAEQKLSEQDALQVGLGQKAREFAEKGCRSLRESVFRLTLRSTSRISCMHRTFNRES